MKEKKLKISKKTFLTKILPIGLAVVLVAAGIGIYFGTGPHYYGARHLVEASNPKEISDTVLTEEYVGAVRELGFKLLEGSDTSVSNLYSPFSMSAALSMMLAATGHDQENIGNSSETFLQIRDALGFSDMSLDAIYAYNRAAIEKSYLSSEKAKFQTSNSIWYNENKNRIDPAETFKSTLKKYFYADFFAQDFGKESQTIKNMNKWVSDKTDGMIKEAVKEIDGDTVLMAFNTVFFEGEWETKFEKSATAPRDFKDSAGNVSRPDFMKSPAPASYKGNDKFSAVKIPYSGKSIYFLAALPKEGSGVEELIKDKESMELLFGKNWTYNNTETESEPSAADYYLPKFKFDCDYDLADIMKGMGIIDAFDPGKADFSAMQNPASPKDFYLGEAKQKTVIDLNEERTRAAAVTIWAPRGTAISEPLPIVYFDRPFVFAIVTSDGLPLFMGTMEKPVY